MTARLILTAAGAASVAHDVNLGTEAVTFTRLALGSGTGAGDQSARTVLDAQHDIEDVTGSTTDNRIALRADYAPTQAYAVTEVGLFARIGGGAEFLAAYWIGEAAPDAVAAAAPGTALIVAGVVEVQRAGADIAVAPAVNISVGVPGDVVREDRHATESDRGLIELSTQPETDAGADDERAVTPRKLAVRLAAYATRTWVAEQIAALGLAAYATRAWVTAQLQALPAVAAVPTGTILDFAGTVAPAGYALCDGGLLSRTAEAGLFGVIGTTYGAGDGATTFARPDFRRRVAVGAGGSSSPELAATVGSTGGEEEVRLTSAEMPAHSHGSGTYEAETAGSHAHSSGSYRAATAGSHRHTVTLRRHPSSGNVSDRYAPGGESGSDVINTSNAGSHSHDVSGVSADGGSHAHDVSGVSSSTGGGDEHNNLQPSVVVMKIIKL